jgi:hypothetical protein
MCFWMQSGWAVVAQPNRWELRDGSIRPSHAKRVGTDREVRYSHRETYSFDVFGI